MTDPYLIAHRVRNEPAFDVAIQLPCVHCQAYESITGAWCEPEKAQEDCIECDALGFWWIIPTSGHRAYPWWYIELGAGVYTTRELTVFDLCPSMPEDLQDHYHLNQPAQTSKSFLLARLNLHRTHPPIVRRI